MVGLDDAYCGSAVREIIWTRITLMWEQMSLR
jgi:hypothetical protein